MKPPFAKRLPPLTADEMRMLWHRGDPFASIAEAARRRNGIPRSQVRALLFGPQA